MDPASEAAGSAGPLSLPTSLTSQLITLGVTPLPDDPARLLAAHLDVLPGPLLRQLGALVPPRARARIPRIRQRRHVWAHPASSSPAVPDALPSTARTARTARSKPEELTAAEGRIRWPLLWEQLGGDPALVPDTAAQRDAVRWAETEFMPGEQRHVGRLARLMGEEEEVGAWRRAAQNRARERRLQAEGEEFDSESDDDGAEEPSASSRGARAMNGGDGGLNAAGLAQFADVVAANPPAGPGRTPPQARSQAEVEAEFEKRLLELFLDGLDTLDYDDIDFTPAEDPIADRDREDRYFDDEAPSTAAGGVGNGHGAGDKAMENGQGEYDY